MSSRSRLAFFFGVSLGLYLLRVSIAYLAAPVSWLPALNIATSALFVGLPIAALFVAAAYPWTARTAIALGVAGVVLHVGSALLLSSGMGSPWIASLASVGLMAWCMSLGTLLALLLKDRNLLLPVAAFLAGFDMFLVFAPTGPTKVMIQRAPEVFQAVAMAVPRVAAQGEATGVVRALAYVGPADLFFLAMFFGALFKFQMRVRETVRWIVPVMIAYLLVVLLFGHVQLGPMSLAALPALLPIGLTVLLVNRGEFRLNAEEKLSTLVVVAISMGLAAFGLIQALRAPPAKPSAPSPWVGAPAPPKSASSPGPESADPPP